MSNAHAKVGLSYRQHQNNVGGPYDAIVIGSGIGGLGAAAFLSRYAGKRVLVLERHYTAGGFTHTFRRPGYEWDVGLHYIGEVFSEKSEFFRVMDDVTDGKMQWASMGDVYDRIVFPDRAYDFRTGQKNFRDGLAADFPDEARAIDNYLDMLSDFGSKSRFYFVEKVLPRAVSSVTGRLMRKGFLSYSDRTTYDVLSSLTANPRLIAVLAGQYGDYGLPPKKSSFAIHAMVAGHYLRGGAYPVGGSGRFAETIAPIIENNGGRIMIKAEVAQIIIERNRAVGIKMKDGQEIRAPLIISDAGIINTWKKLLPQDVACHCDMNEHLKHISPSPAHVCLYVGLKYSDGELGLQKTNLWVYPGNDHNAQMEKFLENPDAPFPVVFISFPSAKDPEFQKKFPGRATIEVITIAKYEWFQKWEDKQWRHRGADYETLKAKFSERLLEALYEQVPQIRGKIDFYELSTPLSTRTFANYERGEIYGLDHTPSRFRQSFLRPETPVRGLYLTGQDVCSAGIGGALFGAVLATSAIMKRDVLSLIRKRRVKEQKTRLEN